jgi:hypothetical protein
MSARGTKSAGAAAGRGSRHAGIGGPQSCPVPPARMTSPVPDGTTVGAAKVRPV